MLDPELVVLDLPRCAVGDLPAEVEHDDAIAEAHHGAHVVLDEQDGDAPIADASHRLHHPVRLLRVHAREGLVEEEHLRVARHRDGDAEGAQVAVRQVPCLFVLHPREPEVVEDLVGAVAEGRLVLARHASIEKEADGGRPPAQVVGDDDVLQGAHLLEDRRLLERADHPLAGHQVGGETCDVLALEDHAAGRPREERGDQLEEGALAGAVRPDDAEHLALVRLERHVVDRHEAAEPLRQVSDLHDDHASAFMPGRAGSRRLRSPLGSQSISVIMIAAYVSIWYSRRPWRSSKPRNSTKAPTSGPDTYESPPAKEQPRAKASTRYFATLTPMLAASASSCLRERKIHPRRQVAMRVTVTNPRTSRIAAR